MIAFVLNLALALIWFFLGDQPDGARLVVGFTVGFALIYLFRGALPPQDYTRRAVAFIVFVITFFSQLIWSNVELAWLVLTKPVDKLRPCIFTYPVEGLRPFEILLLSHSLSLMPGTSTIDIEDDFRVLRVHAIDTSDVDATRRHIHDHMQRRILAFTR